MIDIPVKVGNTHTQKRQENLPRTSRNRFCSSMKGFCKTVALVIQKIWRYMASHVGSKTRCVLSDHQLMQKHSQIIDPHNPVRKKTMRQEYARNHQNVVGVAYGAGVPGGAGVGAGVGAGLGAIAGPVGAGLGACIGLVAGGIAGAITVKASLHCHYKAWEKKNINQIHKEALINFHKDHPEMVQFCCPISGEFMRDPVITPYGDVYERSSIEEHISTKLQLIRENPNLDKNILDPLRKGPLHFDDLKKDYLTLLKMHKAYSDLVEHGIELEDNEIGSRVKEGLIALKKDLDFEMKLLMKRILQSQSPKYVDNIMRNPEGVNMFLDDQEEVAQLVGQIGRHGCRNLRISLAAALLKL